jgi:small subunit ribosomal protein S13
MAEEKEFRLLVRIGNVDIDGNKKVCYALSKIKGVSFSFANAVCQVSGIDKFKKIGDLTDAEVKKLDEIIFDPLKYKIPKWLLNRRMDYETGEDKHLLSGDLDFTKSNDIRRLRRIKSRRGLRHAAGLPVRGQRTRGNFRKGASIGVQRKKIAPARE